MLANRWVRRSFFVLFPMVLITGILVEMRNRQVGRFPGVEHLISRDVALAEARRFLTKQGLDLTQWTGYCAANTDVDLLRFLYMPETASRNGFYEYVLPEIAPPATIVVLYRSPDYANQAEVTLSLDGKVTGYDLQKTNLALTGPDPNDEASLEAADSLLNQNRQVQRLFASARPEVTTVDAITRKYTWRAPVAPRRAVELVFSTKVRRNKPLSRSLKATVNADLAAFMIPPGEKVVRYCADFYWLYLLIVAIYSVANYGRRAVEREVSHPRTLWIALITGVLLMCVLATGHDVNMITNLRAGEPVTAAFIYSILAVGVAGAGLLIGIGYGSGEGHVREAYPGKLTSLDALVLGKVFSKNVSGSILVGFMFAGWMIFFTSLLEFPFAAPTESAFDRLLRFPFLDVAWLSLLAVPPAIAIVFSVSGLLQPLAVEARFFRTKGRKLGFLILCATLAAFGAAGIKLSMSSFLICLVVYVPLLLVSFFSYDLLASLVAVAAADFITSIVGILAALPSMTTMCLWLSGVAAITIIAACFAWRYGRLYKEEEVRPEYAKHIAERQTLQAEVSAAREAQLRLLPHNPPQIPGLSITASCLPARVVGGDFYDFFPLGDDRLGIFIAEGGNRGLASALTIALAKGYLMHTARRSYSPLEVVQKLEATLGGILDAGVAHTTVAYAVIDIRQNSIRYARTGAYPKVIVAPGDGVSNQMEQRVPTPGTARRFPIHEGSAALSSGDSILLYTDGIGKRIAACTAMQEERWVTELAAGHVDAGQLSGKLFECLNVSHDGERDDDDTAIVIRFAKPAAVYMEVVA